MKGSPSEPVELNGIEHVAVLVQGNGCLMLVVELNAYVGVAKLI